MCTRLLALIPSEGVPPIVNVNESQDVPSMHMSSDVIRPSSGSPIAPPAVAVPCHVMVDEVVLMVPVAGLDASAVGKVTSAMVKAARTHTSAIRTPKEFSGRDDMIRENRELFFPVLF